MKNKSKIKLFIADNGNFNITTDWGVIGLYNSWSCCESWALHYQDNYASDVNDDMESFVDYFNNQNLEVEKKHWNGLFSHTKDSLYADFGDWEYNLKLTNGYDLEIISGDNGFYSCRVIEIKDKEK